MDKFFFSEKNISNQSTYLEKILNIRDDKESKRRCRKFLVQQMKEVYMKYGKKRPPGMEAIQFIDQLNKKSIKDCVKICEDRKREKNMKKYEPSELNKFERARDEEIHGKRRIQIPKRPQYTVPNKGGLNTGMPSYSDGVGSAGYAPIASGNGGYITATGEVGDKMFFGNQVESMYGQKASSKDELETRMMALANNYNQRGNGIMTQPNGSMTNMTEGFMSSPNGNMPEGFMSNSMQFNPNSIHQSGLSYNPNIMQQGNGMPPKIDFSLDGGDPRGKNGNRQSNYPPNYNNYMQQSTQQPIQQSMQQLPNIQMTDPMMQAMMQAMMQNGNMNNNNQEVVPVDNMMGNLMNFDNMNNMQNFGNNQNTTLSTNGMNEAELKTHMQKLLAERSQIDTQVESTKQQQKFDPTVSPNLVNNNMMKNIQTTPTTDINQLLMLQKMQEIMTGNNGGNHLNFKGREQYINTTGMGKSNQSEINLNSLTTEQLEEQIKILKDQLFTSESISIKNTKKKKKKQENIEHEKITLIKNKKDELMKLIQELKEEKVDIKDEQNYIDSIQKSVIENPIKNQEIIPNNIKYYTLHIKPEEYTDAMYFNDYMVNLKETLTDIISFEITSISLPPINNNIFENDNKFVYVVDEIEKTIELPEGYYDINKLIISIEKGFNHYKDNIIIKYNNNGYVLIKNTDNKEFKILSSTVAKLLGFKKSIYCDKSSYRSDDKQNMIKSDKIYLFIENIIDDKPFAEFDLNNDLTNQYPIKKVFEQGIIHQLSDFIIKFKTSPMIEEDIYYDFHGKSHEIICKIGYINN